MYFTQSLEKQSFVSYSNSLYLNNYAYDAASNRTSPTLPDASNDTYAYDTLNRLKSITDSVTGQFNIGYGLGSVTSLSSPSAAVDNSYVYDTFGNITASSGSFVNPYQDKPGKESLMQLIQFKGRELKSYAEPVTVNDLQKGSVYFAVQFADRDMLIPTVETLIFVGRSNDPDRGLLFQTVDSYNAGVRFESATEQELLSFRNQSEDQLNHIFDYDHALNELMKCGLRRDRFLRQPRAQEGK